MSLGTGSSEEFSHSSKGIQAIGPEEQKLVDRMTALGMDQANAIKFVMEQTQGGQGQMSSLQLSPADQAQLDASYAGGEANLRRFGNLMGQDLAGTRGLNTSDTPVSEAVLRETLPAYQQLMSSKAQQGLGLGMNMRQMNEGARQFNLQALLGGATAMPSGLGFNLGRMQADRMANSSETGNTRGYKSDSIMTQVGQGAAAYNQFAQGTSSLFGSGGKSGGAAGAMAFFSDQRLKRDIAPVSWNWKTGGNEQLGVIAQDVQKSHPHLVSTDADGLLSVDYGAMTAMLLNEREWLYAELASVRDLSTRSPRAGE